MIRDLLNPSSGFLELREDGRGVVVAGISEVQAKKTSEVSMEPLIHVCVLLKKVLINSVLWTICTFHMYLSPYLWFNVEVKY